MSGNSEKIKRLATYVSRNPGDSFSKFALALELLKNNQVEKALVLFRSVYDDDPEYVGVYYHLGKLYQQLSHFGEAEICFRKGIDVAGSQGKQQTLTELKEALELLLEVMNNE